MPTPKWKIKRQQKLEAYVRGLLEEFGYDLKDRNFADTPKRVARIWMEELAKPTPTPKLFKAFPEEHSQMITLLNHPTQTRCPHHLERVRLVVSVGYIPNGYVVGLSKLARIADFYAQGLVLQETYADALAEGLFHALKAKGVGVYVRGKHDCMQARGVKTQGEVVTTALRGVFLEEPATREEFLSYVMKGGT
jgi:GTP cyclohydrolase I